jgi:hypothetical protein
MSSCPGSDRAIWKPRHGYQALGHSNGSWDIRFVRCGRCWPPVASFIAGHGAKDSSGDAATEEIRRDALPTLAGIRNVEKASRLFSPAWRCTAEVQNTAKQ